MQQIVDATSQFDNGLITWEEYRVKVVVALADMPQAEIQQFAAYISTLEIGQK